MKEFGEELRTTIRRSFSAYGNSFWKQILLQTKKILQSAQTVSDDEDSILDRALAAQFTVEM